MGTSEDGKVVCAVASRLAVGVESIACNDERREIGRTTALAGNSSSKRAVKAIVLCKGASRGLFNDGEGWRYLENVELSSCQPKS